MLTDEQSKRSYKLWFFSVTHGMMLLRSPSSDTQSSNVDLIFRSVDHLKIPMQLDGIRIHPRSPDRPGRDGKIFILESSNRQFAVEALDLRVEENELGPEELPFETPETFWRAAEDAGYSFEEYLKRRFGFGS